MAVEIEAKMSVPNFATIRERLTAAGATLAGEYLERNTFYDTEDRSLLAADEGLRIRLNREIRTGRKTCKITFKGARQHGKLKSREETELVAGSFEGACTLLDRLRFSRVLTFEKRRDVWQLDSCEVDLDEVPLLGTFVEIEGPSEDAVLKVRKTLKMDDRPLIRASYVALLLTHLQEQGKPAADILFPANAAFRTESADTAEAK